jgi:hypothetical protein
MTYIRMTDGRDKGQIKDVPFVTAMELIKFAKALPIDFNGPNPLAVREVPKAETSVASVAPVASVAEVGNVDLRAAAGNTSRLNQITRKKSR